MKFIQDKKHPNPGSIKNKVDFETILKRAQAAHPGLSNSSGMSAITKGVLIAGTAAVLLVAAWFYNRSNNTNAAQEARLSTKILVSDSSKVEALDQLPFTSIFIHNGRDTFITLASGSTLKIPAHSFGLDEVEIEIKCREFRDQLDFALAGLHMETLSDGKKYQLESAGMIEVRAWKEGSEIDLNAGKEITISLVSNTADTDFDLYEYHQTGWVNIGKDQVITPNSHVVLPERYQKQKNAFFEEIRVLESRKTKAAEELQKASKKMETLNAFEMLEPRLQDVEKQSFTFDYKREEFPELKVFDSTIFEIDESRSTFHPSYFNVVWEDLNLQRDTANAQCYSIELTPKGGLAIQLYAYPVVPEHLYASSLHAFETYELERTHNEELIQQSKIEFQELATDIDKRKTFHKSKEMQWKKELNVNFARDTAITAQLQRRFNISSMGTFNCDRMIPPFVSSNSGWVKIEFEAQDQAYFSNKIYLVPRNTNTAMRTTEALLNNGYRLGSDDYFIVAFSKDLNSMLIGKVSNLRNNTIAAQKRRVELKAFPMLAGDVEEKLWTGKIWDYIDNEAI